MNYQANVANRVLNFGSRKSSFLLSFVLFLFSFVLAATSGYSASVPAVSLSSTSLYFGYYAVGSSSSPENLFVTNSGKVAMTVTSVTLAGTNPKDFIETNNCVRSLAAGAQCLVQVVFKPTATGTRSTILSIADNATGSPQKVTFSGTATAAPAAPATAPAVTLSSTSLYFGNFTVGTKGGPENLTVTNSGNASLTVTSINLSGANAADFSQNQQLRIFARGGCLLHGPGHVRAFRRRHAHLDADHER